MTTSRDPVVDDDPADDGRADHTETDELDELVTAMLTASRALVGVSARSLEGVDESVTLTQFRTLVVLHGHGATRLNRLAARIGVNASTALRSVDKLVASGFVDRSASDQDRREVVIQLTPRGRGLVDTVTHRRREVIAEIVRGMPAAHRDLLVDALLEFSEAADEPLVADSATSLGW